jgi:hypothetical protein
VSEKSATNRVVLAAGMVAAVLVTGCAAVQPVPPFEQSPPAPAKAAQPEIAAEPARPAESIPPTAPSAVPRPPAPSAATNARPAVAAAPAKPPARPPAVVATSKPPPPVAAPAPVPVAPKPSPAPLDLTSLETRLRGTKAIGVFTKVSLKNQVDDLLSQFRVYHKRQAAISLVDLRRSYDMLLLKVLSLLQDSDPALAHDIVSSRAAIWGILADPEKFSSAHLMAGDMQ